MVGQDVWSIYKNQMDVWKKLKNVISGKSFLSFGKTLG